MNPDPPPPVDPDALDDVLAFLPLLEREGFSAGTWKAPPGQFPYMALTDEIMAFLSALNRSCLLFPYDWGAWRRDGHYAEAMAHLDRVDLSTIRRLLTLHVRTDRFVEGHLAAVLEDGEIAAILRRLRVLRADLAP